MAHDPFGNRRYSAYGPDPTEGYGNSMREEFELMRRRLDDTMREMEHWREKALNISGQAEWLQRESIANGRYIRVLELALYLASGNDQKKVEFLNQAKTSIDVLKTFEK